MLTMIAAHAKNNVIGAGNRLPWRCPADMAYFSKTSKSYRHILMGTTTAKGIGHLPDREIHKFSRTPNRTTDSGELTFTTVEDVLSFNKHAPLLVCGGQQVYTVFLPYASTLLLTQLDIDVCDGDAWFPHYTSIFDAKRIIEQGVSNNIPYRVVEYTRKPL